MTAFSVGGIGTGIGERLTAFVDLLVKSVPRKIQPLGRSREDDSSDSNLGKKLRVLGPPMMFCLIYLAMVLSGLFSRFSLYARFDARYDEFNSWIQCIFENYYDNYTSDLDASTPSGVVTSYLDVDQRQVYAYAACGESPPAAVSLGALMWFFFSMFGHPLMIALIFMKFDNLKRLCDVCCG